jgi:hypothetical protein
MPLLQGRDFRPQDNQSSTKVGVINETLSRYYSPMKALLANDST